MNLHFCNQGVDQAEPKSQGLPPFLPLRWQGPTLGHLPHAFPTPLTRNWTGAGACGTHGSALSAMQQCQPVFALKIVTLLHDNIRL